MGFYKFLCINIILLLILIFFVITSKPAFSADTNTVSSTVVTDKSVPTANAPSVVVNNSDICKTATSGAVQTQILGIATGVTVRDENCERLKLSRSLYAMGMKVAAVSTLCADYRVFDAMWNAGTYCPYMGKIGMEAKKGWENNPTLVPKGSLVFSHKDSIKPIEKVENDDGFKEFIFFAMAMYIGLPILF